MDLHTHLTYYEIGERPSSCAVPAHMPDRAHLWRIADRTTAPSGKVVSRLELPGLTPKLAALFAKAGPRTLSRDLNRLHGVGLIVKQRRGWKSNDSIINAFMPPIADGGNVAMAAEPK